MCRLPSVDCRLRHTECACYFGCGSAALGRRSAIFGEGRITSFSVCHWLCQCGVACIVDSNKYWQSQWHIFQRTFSKDVDHVMGL